jgi:hypothetical protein
MTELESVHSFSPHLVRVVCLQHGPNNMQAKKMLIGNYLLCSKTLLQRRLMKSMAIVMGWKEKVLVHQVRSRVWLV